MASTTARTQQDVDNMSKKDRLWDSLNYSYGKKRESSEREYDRAYSQADRQALSRGMQRSSYNAQNLANINQRKIEASNDIWDTQIADYENRLGALEQQEAEADRWERQFAASREDAAWNKDFQQKQADINQSNFQLQFNAGREDAAWNKAFQERQYGDSRADADWQKQFQERQYGDSRADADWQKQFQQQQYEANRADTAWNQAFQQRQYEADRADTAWNQAFQQEQANIQRDQWEKQFGYAQKSDSQKIAMQYAMSIIQNRQMPTDELLAQAGLSRADAERMIAQASGGGSGSGGKGGKGDKQSDAATGAANGTLAGIGAFINGASAMDSLVDAYNNYGNYGRATTGATIGINNLRLSR